MPHTRLQAPSLQAASGYGSSVARSVLPSPFQTAGDSDSSVPPFQSAGVLPLGSPTLPALCDRQTAPGPRPPPPTAALPAAATGTPPKKNPPAGDAEIFRASSPAERWGEGDDAPGGGSVSGGPPRFLLLHFYPLSSCSSWSCSCSSSSSSFATLSPRLHHGRPNLTLTPGQHWLRNGVTPQPPPITSTGIDRELGDSPRSVDPPPSSQARRSSPEAQVREDNRGSP